MAYISSLGLIARVGVGVAILAGMCGLGAIVQCVRDQHKPVVCECGASDWLEADECGTCLMCGSLRRR